MALENLITSFLKKLMGGEDTAQTNSEQQSQVNNYDPVEQQINRDGYVWQSRLWRRHVMSQMFRLLHRKSGLPISEENYDALVSRRGCTYTWRMLAEELRAQSLLFHDDPEQFAERNRWFNRAVVVDMAQNLVSQGVEEGAKVLNNLSTANDPNALLAAVVKPMEWTYVHSRKKSLAWLDAYKGAGAYFTMKNLILFHKCTVHLDGGLILDRNASFAYIRDLNSNPAVNGQQMFAVMMRLITDNNFDWG